MKLGPTLKKIRNSAGLSLRQAGDGSGVSYPHLCDIENEKCPNPTVRNLDKLAGFYGVPVDDLFKAALKSVRSKKTRET